MSTSLFNVRLDDDLIDDIEARAAEVGVKKSVWAREVLAACAQGGVTMEDLKKLMELRGTTGSPHPARHLTLQGTTGRIAEGVTGRCIHPRAGRIQLAFSQRCGVCGAELKK